MNPAVKPTAEGAPERTRAFRAIAAFTLLELLVVITILGILAALTVPVLKNLGKSSVQLSASRQLLDDLARARQLAISQRTTVYMVFVPTNFFGVDGNLMTTLGNLVDPAARLKALITATNLVPLQLTGYNFIALGQVGDQPGQHQWRYLDDWKSLPDGTFIPPQKFSFNGYSLLIPQWQTDFGNQIDQYWRGNNQQQIYSFTNRLFPFPTADVTSQFTYLPYVAFDYQGRLISEVSANGIYHHAYIPLALGTVSYGRDARKRPLPTPVSSSDITENPPGNSTNLSYNVIDINPQTGRASLHSFQMK